jgi:TPR repeat protein
MWNRHGALVGLSVVLMGVAAAPAGADEAQHHHEAGLEASAQREYAAALGHFGRAAALGHRDAQRTRGMMLLYGSALYGAEVPRRPDEAWTLLKAAAGAGCEQSAFLLRHARPRPQPAV